jgi:hypothetical protein
MCGIDFLHVCISRMELAVERRKQKQPANAFPKAATDMAGLTLMFPERGLFKSRGAFPVGGGEDRPRIMFTTRVDPRLRKEARANVRGR